MPGKPRRPGALDGSDEERELLALARSDRRAAVERLYDLYGKEIFGYCRKFLASDTDAREAFQEVYFQVIEGLSHFEGRSSFRTWLFTIARNRCIDLARGSRRQIRARTELSEEAAEDSTRDAEAMIIDRDLVAALEACLDRLPARSRAAVVLKYHDGLSYKEIGSIVRANAGALRVRVMRAMDQLRDCLETRGHAV